MAANVAHKNGSAYDTRVALAEVRGEIKNLYTMLEEREKNVILKALEYERRLTELNHAHDKQVMDQATYVSNDTFGGFTKRVGDLEKRDANSAGITTGKAAAWAIIVALLSTLAGLAVSFLKG